jgi:hypothetical protein
MAATQTLIAMTSESRSAATNDSIHDLAVLPGQMRSMPFPEVAALSANDAGHLEGGHDHGEVNGPTGSLTRSAELTRRDRGILALSKSGVKLEPEQSTYLA